MGWGWKESPFIQEREQGNPADPGAHQESGGLGLGGRDDTPTSGFMTSDSARAFPSLRQWSIESGVGLQSPVPEGRETRCLDAEGGYEVLRCSVPQVSNHTSVPELVFRCRAGSSRYEQEATRGEGNRQVSASVSLLLSQGQRSDPPESGSDGMRPERSW